MRTPEPGVRRSYPLARRGTIIGRPFQGTHRLGNWQSDRAFDLRVPVGTPVLAIWNGVIGERIGPISNEPGRFAGLRIYVEVPGGNAFYYAHLSRFRRGIRAGVAVEAGDVIGYSGMASGVPHLHVAAMLGDPYVKLLSGRLPIVRRLTASLHPRALLPATTDAALNELWECAGAVPAGEGELYLHPGE